MKPSSIYIHIPFCEHKCIYCDFYSIITEDNINNFFSALKKEIDYRSGLYSKDREYISIYFGGGTPSLMQPQAIEDIINYLYNKFSFIKNPEITLETNPGTVDLQKLIEFKLAGINRLSIGVQSFDENDLKFLTRIHDKQTAIKTVHNAVEAGFENISIDLIFNLPGQTKDKWIKNLETAVKLPLKHISAYSLILEHGTILNKMVLDGKVKIQDDDYDADLYETTMDFLEAENFLQYEVSNFAVKGFESVHNNSYWQYKDYLGFGPSAHSFVNGERMWNYSSLKFYIDAVNKHNTGLRGSELLSQKQMLEEYVMLAFRSGGLNLDELNAKFGSKWMEHNQNRLNKFIESGFIKRVDNFISLTKKGYALCDEIIAKFV